MAAPFAVSVVSAISTAANYATVARSAKILCVGANVSSAKENLEFQSCAGAALQIHNIVCRFSRVIITPATEYTSSTYKSLALLANPKVPGSNLSDDYYV